MYATTALDPGSIRWDDNGTIKWIPVDSGNADYQKYLAWLAEGNEPEIIAAP